MRGALATATDVDFYSASGRSYAISLNGDW